MFKLTIRTPQEDIYTGQAASLTLASEDGEMQILEDHASITASLNFTPIIVVEESGNEEHYLARNGIFLFNNEENSGILLVNYCEKTSEISMQTIEEYSKFLDEQLAQGKDLSQFQVLYLKNEKVAVEEQMETMEK